MNTTQLISAEYVLPCGCREHISVKEEAAASVQRHGRTWFLTGTYDGLPCVGQWCSNEHAEEMG